MCTDRLNRTRLRRQSGITLIETILFIVIVGVGVAGLVGVMNSTLKYSADPMIRKQAVAVAESLLEEIMLQPFTESELDSCDTSSSPATCTQAEAMGPDTVAGVTESRGSLTAPFDNVNDYHGYRMDSGILSVADNQVISGLENYKAEVSITQVGTAFSLADASRALKINVKVTDPNGGEITLTGYRFRYDPKPFD